jgi:nitrogen fixation NifU-like protein
MNQNDKKAKPLKASDEKDNVDLRKDHSLRYLEMAFKTEKRERIQSPDGYGKRTGECGDTIEMFLTMDDDVIRSASFDADGCMNTVACANTVVWMAEGRTVSQAWRIKAEDVVNYLETLPEKEFHCAELAVGALYLALSNSRETKNSPWKKDYKKY